MVLLTLFIDVDDNYSFDVQHFSERYNELRLGINLSVNI